MGTLHLPLTLATIQVSEEFTNNPDFLTK